MAPGVDLTICATPVFWAPARALEGHLTVDWSPSDQSLGAAVCRNSAKFCVVPEESERTAGVIAVLGRLTPGLSDVIAESFHLVILPEKICAMTGAVSLRLLTPVRLYDSVIGPIKTGKYSTVLPLKLATSLAGIGESEPANWTTPEARSVRPVPEPTLL